MKKTIIIIILFLLTNTLFATSNKVDKTKEAQAKAWAKNQQLEFIENKGQFISTEGKPAENVLFKASYGNCDIYITDKGLSYVFVKFEDKEKEDSITNYELRITKGKKRLGEREDDDENKVPMYYRLDMDLMGATIDKANIIKEEVEVNEVSSELLGRYKDKAKKSADALTAAGKHKQSTDRWMNVMKATGKQIDKTNQGIRKALNKEEMMKSARIIKDLYKKKNMKEEMYDHEKDDKGSQSLYGKPPKVGKSKEEGESTNKAAAVLKGGTTLTGQGRDTIEIDPMMRTRPTNGASPEDARSKKSIG